MIFTIANMLSRTGDFIKEVDSIYMGNYKNIYTPTVGVRGELLLSTVFKMCTLVSKTGEELQF